MRPRPGGGSPRLDLGLAIEEGWAAFRRAPWSFVAFALLLTLLTLACSPCRTGSAAAASSPPVPSTGCWPFWAWRCGC